MNSSTQTVTSYLQWKQKVFTSWFLRTESWYQGSSEPEAPSPPRRLRSEHYMPDRLTAVLIFIWSICWHLRLVQRSEDWSFSKSCWNIFRLILCLLKATVAVFYRFDSTPRFLIFSVKHQTLIPRLYLFCTPSTSTDCVLSCTAESCQTEAFLR